MNYILTEKKDGIEKIVFHRPEALNALNSEMLRELSSVIDDAAIDSQVRVIVFTGVGKSFIAGADIKELDGFNAIQALNYSKAGVDLFRKIELLSKPTISAVNGYAYGGGLEFLLCTDIRIMSQKARVRMPEVTLGIIPGFNGTQRLPKCIGMAKAKELIFTGRTVLADEALSLGIVNQLSEPESLLDDAMNLAKTIANNSATAIALAKAAINAGFEQDIEIGINIEAGYMAACFGTPDQREGFCAFKEHRNANYR